MYPKALDIRLWHKFTYSQYLTIIVITVGVCFATIFHFGIKEEKYRKPSSRDTSTERNSNAVNYNIESTVSFPIPDDTISTSINLPSSTVSQQKGGKLKTWKDWLKDIRFYKTALVYVCTRLAINVYQSFHVLYLTDVLRFQKVRKHCLFEKKQTFRIQFYFFDIVLFYIILYISCMTSLKLTHWGIQENPYVYIYSKRLL